MRFRSKLMEIEANQFIHPATAPIGVRVRENGTAYVRTIHLQDAEVVPGDWIILENPPGDGTLAYPCKPDVFARKYEVVPNPDATVEPKPLLPRPPSDFESALSSLLNCHSKENGSNTPDFILAAFLVMSLEAWDVAATARDDWRRSE